MMPALRIIGLSMALWVVILTIGFWLGGGRGMLIAFYLTLAGGAVSTMFLVRAGR